MFKTDRHNRDDIIATEPRGALVHADWQVLGRAVRSRALEAVSMHLAAIGALEAHGDGDEGQDEDGGAA